VTEVMDPGDNVCVRCKGVEPDDKRARRDAEPSSMSQSAPALVGGLPLPSAAGHFNFRTFVSERPSRKPWARVPIEEALRAWEEEAVRMRCADAAREGLLTSFEGFLKLEQGSMHGPSWKGASQQPELGLEGGGWRLGSAGERPDAANHGWPPHCSGHSDSTGGHLWQISDSDLTFFDNQLNPEG
jgi:hypothetical protein